MADVEVLSVDCGGGPDVEIRPIERWPGYYVGRDGSVWRLDCAGRLARLHVHLRNDKKRDRTALASAMRDGRKSGSIYIARAVLTAFVGPPPDNYVARHWPDRDPMNNRVENLRWGPAGAYRFYAAKCAAEDETRVEVPPAQPAPPRFIGQFAELLDDDRRRRRRLMRSRATVESYREAQAKAEHRHVGRPKWRPSPWDRSDGMNTGT